MSKPTNARFEPIAITGISCLFPKATGTGAYWANIKNGLDCIVEVPESHWKLDDFFSPDPTTPDHTYARTGGFLDPVPFNPMEFGISPNALEATDTSQLLTLLTAKQALIDAGYENGKELDRDKVSVILGVTGAQELVIPLGARLYHPLFRETLLEAGLSESDSEEIVKRINHKMVSWQEGSFPGLLGNVVAGRIANRFDFGGTNCVVDAACAGSLSAIHMASMELQSGRADMVLSGGVDTFNDIFMYMCFSKTKALSASGHAKPFDKNGDGTIVGEGVGMVTLKRLSDAEKDNDKIYAVIRGLGTSSDGKGNAIYAPCADGQKKALTRAYETAKVTPETIELLEAHGTGTPVGDAIELTALSDIYRSANPHGQWCALGSVKSQIGHGKAAAGIAGLIKAALAIHHKVLPPTIKVDTPLEALAEKKTPFYLNMEKRPWVKHPEHSRRAAISAFGFGGSNYHAVIEEVEGHQATEPDWDGTVQLLTFSAETPDALLNILSSWTAPDTWEDLRTQAQTLRQSFNNTDQCRLVAVVKQEDDPQAVLQNGIKRLQTENTESWEIPTGIYYGYGEKPGQLALVFSGQGTQYPGMLRDIACQFPEFVDVLDQANAGFEVHSKGTSDKRLSDIIYPYSAFSDDETREHVDTLKLTQHAQPGIGAVSIAGWNVLKNRFHIAPDAAAGHSYGEICALRAADMITDDEFHGLSSLRGQLMSSGDQDRGSMAAVTIPLEDIQAVIDEEKLELVIANKNAPAQGVISGKTEEINKALDVFKKRGLRIIPLKVSAAFHSPLVADATKPFGKHLDKISFKKGSIPVYSNTTAKKYPKQQKQIREILAAQLENPVEFVNEINQMYSDGVRTFLEVGPGRRMSGLVRSVLEDKVFHAIALDQSNGKKSGQEDLARILGQLSALGYAVNLAAWDETYVPAPEKNSKMSALEVNIKGTNFVRPKANLEPFTISQVAKEHVAPPTGMQTGDSPSVSKAFNAIQENLSGLQRLQEQTALLHQQFLQSQQAAQMAFQGLVTQQQTVLTGQPPTQPPIQLPTQVPIQMPIQTSVQTPVQMPVQPPIQTPVHEATAPASASQSALSNILMDVVSDKTGYPTDLLEPDMELDSDLGIDSIKRVEILSALQEKMPQLPTINPDQMAGIRKLNDIIVLMEAVSPATTAASIPVSPTVAPTDAPTSAPGAPIETPSVKGGSISKDMLMTVVSEKTGYPVDLLEPDMELDSDLGIDSIKRVEILSALQEKLPGLPTITPEKMSSIRTLKDILIMVTMMETSAPASQGVVKKKKGVFDTQPIGIKRANASGSEKDIILDIIAEKTGYPVDLLEPDMELDTDLGIDSIKRVEILAALQVQFSDLPDIKPEQLADIRNVSDIIAIVGRVRAVRTGRATGRIAARKKDPSTRIEPKAAPSEIQTPSPKDIAAPPAKPATPAESEIPVTPEPVMTEPQKVTPAEPKPVKEMKLTKVHRGTLRTIPVAENRKQVVYPEHAEIWITRDDCGLSESIFEEFENQFIPCRLVSPDYLEFVELPDQIAGLIMVGPRDTCSMKTLNKNFELVKLVGEKLRRKDADSNERPMVVSIIRLDGEFGLSDQTVDFQPMTAALAGMTKTISHEWPEATCKIIDIDADRDYEPDMVDLMQELFIEGPLEMGISSRGKVALELVDSPQDPNRMTGEPLIPGNWVMVTGGARGVTAACAMELASRFSVNLVLLGRSPAPTPEPEWLARLDVEAEIKKAIMTESGSKMSPRELNTIYDNKMKNREMLKNITQMKLQGVNVRYVSVDVTDQNAVQTTVSNLKKEGIVVEGLVHGAGIISDKLIEEKDPESFDKVVRTKIESLRYISENLDLEKLRILVLFSSSTARFGRKGQVDYAVANEVLNKFAQKFSRLFPNCRTLAMNWGPWDGGMVTPDLKKLFKSEGIETINLLSGARLLTRELRLEYGKTVHTPVELVLLGSQDPDGDLPGDLEPVWEGDGGEIKNQQDQSDTELDNNQDVEDESTDSTSVYQLDVSTDTFPVLKSHLINGLPVVPMSLFMEFAAQGAKISHPNLHVYSMENFRLLKGIILRPDTSVILECCVGKSVREDRMFRVQVELKGTHPDGKKFVHVGTDILMTPRLPEAPEAPKRLKKPEPYPIHQGQLYSEVLFHGDLLQSIRSVEGVNEEGITAAVDGVPNQAEWMQDPLGDSWITDPLSNDAAFQMMILWTELMLEMPSLPCGFTAFRQYTSNLPSWSVADIRVKEQKGNQVFADIFFKDDHDVVIAVIENYECITDSALRDAFKVSRNNY